MYLAAAMSAAKAPTFLLKYVAMMEILAQCPHFTEPRQSLMELNRTSTEGLPPPAAPSRDTVCPLPSARHGREGRTAHSQQTLPCSPGRPCPREGLGRWSYLSPYHGFTASRPSTSRKGV